jgi:C_GCAxxG_C_C family probable redox protein
MSKADNAEAMVLKGFNCSQSVACAFAEEFGLDKAVTGAVIVIGLKYGITEAGPGKSNAEAYKKVQELVEQFKARNGTHLCRDLLGFDIDNREEFKAALKQGIPQKVCPKTVRDAAEIVEGLIK